MQQFASWFVAAGAVLLRLSSLVVFAQFKHAASIQLTRYAVRDMVGKGKILVVSRDPKLADIRKTLLEAAGFAVIPQRMTGP